MSKINVNDIRVGNIIEYESKPWVVCKTMHTQPGKGGAYMQLEIKDIKHGTKNNIRLRTSDTIEKVHMEKVNYQFLYFEGDMLVLMDNETYEQIFLSKNLVPEGQLPFLSEGMSIIVEFAGGEAALIHLPSTWTFTIEECEMALANQTAAPSYKTIRLENGVVMTGPTFLNAGDKIIVNIETRDYVKRAE